MNFRITKTLRLVAISLCILCSLLSCNHEFNETKLNTQELKHEHSATTQESNSAYNQTTQSPTNGHNQNKKCVHSKTEWIVYKKATLESEGIKHKKCLSCGTLVEVASIPELYLTQAEITEKLEKSVVKVICYDYDGTTELSQGSGFFIDKQGTFITNAHVVKDCYYIKIQTYLGVTYDVNRMYVYNNIVSDYAVCQAKNAITTPVEFEEFAEVGETVYALGYPNDAITLSTTNGVITSNNTTSGNLNCYSNTAWIDHGSSGGVLVNDKGKVIGITTGQFQDEEYAALKYTDFKYDANTIHAGIREPLDYFHTVKEYRFNSLTMQQYFDIYVDVVFRTDTMVSYNVAVQLKQQYRTKKILLDKSATITIELETKFDYYKKGYYIDSHQTEKKSDTIYFYFYSEDDLKRGATSYSSNSIFLSTFDDYYGMNISYEVDFYILQTGTILIFD